MAKKKRSKTRKKSTKAKRSGLSVGLKKLIKRGLFALLAIGLVALVVLDYRLTSRFSGNKWSLPSHVYSRALELYEGLELSRDGLVWELEKLGYRRVATLNAAGQYRLQGRRIDVHSRAFEFWDESKAAQTFTLTFQGSQLSRLRTQQGAPLALVRLEPLRIGGIYPAHLEDRLPVRLEELPPLLVEGLIAVEDRNFYQHYGISIRGISRALVNNL
ncbi:MAG: transglycosylase domain-containing protein, partial [Gammaproteobacteria bacterium]|nr:transglycosylase domain-containing protein [Gammaproteobacteria bacterium]